MIDPVTLRTAIKDLSARLSAMPEIDSTDGDIMDQCRRHRRASGELADHLRATYGARIHEKAWTNTIRMCGISSSGTSGLAGAFRNWIVAAERRMRLGDVP